jgi:imidazolonepropionase
LDEALLFAFSPRVIETSDMIHLIEDGYALQTSDGKRLRVKDLRGTFSPNPLQQASSKGSWFELTSSDGQREATKRATKKILLRGIRRALTMSANESGALGLIEGAALIVVGQQIQWVGRERELPLGQDFDQVIDLRGALVLPGFVDPHTHLIFAGDRSKEYALRLQGASYVDILAAGGGILSTVEATRAASHQALFDAAWPRLDQMLRRGVTTCEAKSGYGLSLESEVKILEVIRRLDATHPVDLVPTLLAAHAIPKEWRPAREGYISLILQEILPKVAQQKLATSCDVFCDKGAFTLEESKTILEAATRLGLAVRIHAEEIEATGGAKLAASLGALSADHLEHIDDDGISAMARAGTVAVLLPGTAVTLRMSPPPTKRLREAGVVIAVGTDLNPGTSYLEDLPLAATLACGLFHLTFEEALLGITKHAAKAVGLAGKVGELTPGAAADLLAYELPSEEHLLYRFGQPSPRWVMKSGRVVISA